MYVCYAQQSMPTTKGGIFLAGPTPRSEEATSWRPKALKLLEEMGYTGNVFVPEDASWRLKGDYTDQVQWEWAGLETSDVIVFWVPRELKTMPAMTTNVEFGLHIASGKCVLGYPEDAPKMRYLHMLAERFEAPVVHTLEETLSLAVERMNSLEVSRMDDLSDADRDR